MTNETKPLSREFDAMLRLIAEDLCNHRRCTVGLLDHDKELRWDSTAALAALNRHVMACNPNYRVEAIERARTTGLWRSGIPFAIINCQTGEERWMQLGGGNPGVDTCERASEEEYHKHQLFIKECDRYRKQQQAGNEQVAVFLNGLVVKLRQLADAAALTEEQRSDFDYHMRVFGSMTSTPKSPNYSLPDQSLVSKLPNIAYACEVLGLTLQQLNAL